MAGGPMGADRGMDEDAEHKRKYDYGPDRAIFDADEVVSPDVIGKGEGHRQMRIEQAERGATRLDP